MFEALALVYVDEFAAEINVWEFAVAKGTPTTQDSIYACGFGDIFWFSTGTPRWTDVLESAMVWFFENCQNFFGS